MTGPTDNAAEQLAAINEGRAAAADRLVTPRWYHPVLGILVAGYTVAYSLGNTIVRLVGVLLFLAACVVLMRTYRNITGVWVSGHKAGRASRWAYAMGGLIGVGLAGGLAIGYFTDLRWPVWVIAAVLFVGTIVLGNRFDQAVRAQLRAGA
ncbi:hypothetical protein [Cryptosporangium sp. NPDC048952]|uniref:hypothetical protein n=1 Tax=Cryptosporangium sp. NPDC048952 TaxID=3363961 RepID=UPI00371E5DFC